MESVNLNFVHSESIGYGRLGVKLAEALEARGVTVFDDMPRGGAPIEGALGTPTGDRRSGLTGNACWVSVPTHADGWWSSQTPSVFTMWEATVLPESFRETLHNFETILVPSEQNLELFGRWHDNVKLVPLGIDPAEWHLTERPEPGAFFDFLIGGSGERKGTDLAHRAFKAAFPTIPEFGPIPRLILKNPKGETFDPMGGQVIVIPGRLDAADEQALYASAHCYIQPSRGEGFGLQPLQAIAQGLPTILTNAHGHAGFAHLGYGLDSKLVPASYFIYGEAGKWWEPDFDQLVERMRWVYDNWGTAVEKAKRSAGEVAERWTWAQTAEAFAGALDLSKPFDGGDWVEPNYKRYRLRVLAPWKADIAGTSYHLKPGFDYFVRADVKRIMAEAGNVDPACLDDDSGLTEAEVAAIGQSTDHLYCHECGTRFGTGKSKADDLYEALV